jgi:hypothetical protein
MKITICGGGNLGHVVAGFLSSQEEHQVSLLTTRPEAWISEIEVVDCRGKVFHGKLDQISAKASEVINGRDLVIVCLPGFAIHDVLTEIRPFLSSETLVGTVVSSTGFFFEAMKLLPDNQPLFGFQRVPFISRIIEYGHSAELKGYKESLSVAVEQTADKESVRSLLEELFCAPTKLLDSYYEVSLSNSNPLLHTARLYSLWKDWKPGISYDSNPGFYEEWTVETSELYIAMDKEFQILLKRIGVKDGAIPPVLQYYESDDAESLTKKISSISAFKGIASPMKTNGCGKYEPDFNSRYFTEDFPYGMRFIVEVAEKYQIEIPMIQHVYNWGMEMIHQ